MFQVFPSLPGPGREIGSVPWIGIHELVPLVWPAPVLLETTESN